MLLKSSMTRWVHPVNARGVDPGVSQIIHAVVLFALLSASSLG